VAYIYGGTYTVSDYLENGFWVKSKALVVDGTIYNAKTRGERLWTDLIYRTSNPSLGTVAGRRSEHYADCVNLFHSFDSFVEWCQCQHGYMNKEENGKYWQLDKDIILPGNKIYSPDTCVFIPNNVNSLFMTGKSRNSKSGLPMGVSTYFRSKNLFTASCRVSDSEKYMGLFNTPMLAHQAWQEAKIGEILRHSRREELGEVVCLALERHARRIQSELEAGVETKLY